MGSDAAEREGGSIMTSALPIIDLSSLGDDDRALSEL
jgi:hypothetical protein